MRQTTLKVIVFLISLWCWSSLVLATGRTNVNEVNDLFDRHIENKGELMRDLQEQREGAVRDIERGEGLQHIEGVNEAESKARELESIKEVDLESSGRQKRASEEYRFYDENELEPDYSKPGNLAHKQDCDEIVSQTGLSMKKLGKDLQTKLSALGIDCKQSKGTTQKDLTYHIEIKGTEHRNSEYEQVFCEEPRNRYNCQDVLVVRCTKRDIRFEPWQNRTLALNLGIIPAHWWNKTDYYDVDYDIVSSWKINPLYHQDIATYIANIIGVKATQINVGYQNIILIPVPYRTSLNGDFSRCPLVPGKSQYLDISSALVTFTYQYRDGYEICEQWSEDWSETCIIQ